MQVLPAVRYSVALTPTPSSPAANEPVTWTLTITRAAPLPSGLTLHLRCAFYDGATGALGGTSDAAFANLPDQLPTAMTGGSSTAVCVTQATYGSAGNATAAVQVFAANASQPLGLLGANTPSSRVLTVRHPVDRYSGCVLCYSVCLKKCLEPLDVGNSAKPSVALNEG